MARFLIEDPSQCYLLISQQSAKKKTCLTSFLVAPYDMLGVSCFLIPCSQKMTKTVMKNARLPRSARFIPPCWAQSCQFFIECRYPSDWNPVFWFLTLIFVQIEDRHCSCIYISVIIRQCYTILNILDVCKMHQLN